MRERDRAESLTALRRRVSAATDRATRALSRAPGVGPARSLRRLWQRHVRAEPDRYQASITFPTAPDRPTIGEIRDWIDALEHAFEGRLDVYARRGNVAVVSDPVAAEQFDGDAFESVCERIEDGYAGTHSLAHVEKWRRNDGRLVRAHVIVPVKPLFPREKEDASARGRSAAEIGAN